MFYNHFSARSLLAKLGSNIEHIYTLRDGVDCKPVTVAVFGDNAELPFAVGNGVSITNVYPWQNTKKAKHSLGMKNISRLEVCALIVQNTRFVGDTA